MLFALFTFPNLRRGARWRWLIEDEIGSDRKPTLHRLPFLSGIIRKHRMLLSSSEIQLRAVLPAAISAFESCTMPARVSLCQLVSASWHGIDIRGRDLRIKTALSASESGGCASFSVIKSARFVVLSTCQVSTYVKCDISSIAILSSSIAKKLWRNFEEIDFLLHIDKLKMKKLMSMSVQSYSNMHRVTQLMSGDSFKSSV